MWLLHPVLMVALQSETNHFAKRELGESVSMHLAARGPGSRTDPGLWVVLCCEQVTPQVERPAGHTDTTWPFL